MAALSESGISRRVVDSGTLMMSVSEFREPDTTRTLPFGRRVPVGYHRLKAIGLARIQAWMFGSKMSTSRGRGRAGPIPSTQCDQPAVGRNVCPAQDVGKQIEMDENRRSPVPDRSGRPSSQVSSLPEFSSAVDRDRRPGLDGGPLANDRRIGLRQNLSGRVIRAAAAGPERKPRFMHVSDSKRRTPNNCAARRTGFEVLASRAAWTRTQMPRR